MEEAGGSPGKVDHLSFKFPLLHGGNITIYTAHAHPPDLSSACTSTRGLGTLIISSTRGTMQEMILRPHKNEKEATFSEARKCVECVVKFLRSFKSSKRETFLLKEHALQEATLSQEEKEI